MEVCDLSPIGHSVYGHRLYRQLVDCEVVVPDNAVQPEPDGKSSKDVLLDEIFAINPRTFLPDGDIAVFLSENTSPQVRDFIRQNLMSDTNIKADSSGFAELSDDDIATFTRGIDESVNSYRSRVINHIRSVKLDVQSSHLSVNQNGKNENNE